MAAVVVDATVLLDLLRGSTRGAAWFASLDEIPRCPEITRVEIVRELRSAERGPAEKLFARLDWVPISDPIARVAGELGLQYRRSHPSISVESLVVAATATVLGAEPATHNVKHFPMFPGLRAPY